LNIIPKTERQKDRKTERQKDRKTERQKDTISSSPLSVRKQLSTPMPGATGNAENQSIRKMIKVITRGTDVPMST
jgi:hypothetical protein